jgi:hypothetical protein
MQPIYFEVDHNLPLMVVPESDAHMDGHPVLTYNYAIFNDPDQGGDHFTPQDSLLTPEKKQTPTIWAPMFLSNPAACFL